jgi:hypothetical protein
VPSFVTIRWTPLHNTRVSASGGKVFWNFRNKGRRVNAHLIVTGSATRDARAPAARRETPPTPRSRLPPKASRAINSLAKATDQSTHQAGLGRDLGSPPPRPRSPCFRAAERRRFCQRTAAALSIYGNSNTLDLITKSREKGSNQLFRDN